MRLAQFGQRMRQEDRHRPWVLDAALIAGIFAVFGVTDLTHLSEPFGPPEQPITFTNLSVPGTLTLQAGLLLPLFWRRRAPSAAFTVVAAVFLLQWSLGTFLRTDVALLIGLYSVALHGRLAHLPWVCAAGIGVTVPVAARVASGVSILEALFFLLSAVTAAVALGLVVRIRRAQLAGLRDRAASLEIERDQRSKLAAATERTRVAREMHDIVGHSLSVIITLADGGAYAADVVPERGKEALRLVGDAARQALGELRRMLGVLHERADTPELNPQPGIADLETLYGRVRAAGADVVYHSGGDLEALDRGVQLMAYRIVQEALTNTLKHAGPGSRAQVDLTVDGAQLHIHVRDAGRRDGTKRLNTTTVEGHGLAGMQERAALYGGTLAAGPTASGGWIVRATLDIAPLPSSSGGLT
jgi:signal transduction histidine kinase